MSFKEMKKYKFAYGMVLPAIIGMMLIHFIPMVQGLYMSLLKLNQYTLKKFLGAPFVWFNNYYEILFNPESQIRAGMGLAARNTFIYATVVNLGCLVVGMLFAMALNEKFKGRGIARTLVLLPWVIPTYVVGLLAQFMLRQNGIINIILVDFLHLLPEKPLWLFGKATIVSIILPTIWRFFPMTTLMLLAGLQQIPKDFYEAAEIDGANGLQKFFYITLPFLKPIIATLLLMGMITHIYSFNIPSMMFGQGTGYPGEWGDLMMTNLQRNSFLMWRFGYGAAASVILMVVVLALTGIWYKAFKDSLTSD